MNIVSDTLPKINQIGQPEVPTSIWQLMLSGGMLLTCGTIIQHAFRGVIYPWKSGRVVVFSSSKEKFGAKFTRSFYFGTFSWLSSLIVGALLNEALFFLHGTRLTQYISSITGSAAYDCYAFLANAVMILIFTPLSCGIGAYLRKRSGKEYIERMKLIKKEV